jgi:transposase
MPRRTIKMIEVEEILYRWTKGMGIRKIAQSLGIARNTVRGVLEKAKEAGLPNDSDALFAQGSDKILEQFSDNKKSLLAQSYLSSYHEQIGSWLSMPYMTVNQMVRLLSEEGKRASETQLRRYIRYYFPDYGKDKKANSPTVHLVVEPGSQAQVDYASCGMMIDPLSGKSRKAYAFIMTLSYSRYRFVRFAFSQDIKTWIDCHIRAFQFFGGVPKTVMPDNLLQSITVANLYDPVINRAYSELEKHYGFVCDPTKVRTPRHKGRVERSVSLARQQILAGRSFKDIEEANDYALNWCRHEIANRVTRTTGQTPWDKFINEEKALLLPLPFETYECPTWCELKVHRDHHIVFEGSFYSVPTSYIGHMVWIRAVSRVIDIYMDHKKIKTHVRCYTKGQWITDQADYPKGARAFLEKGKEECLSQANEIGSSTYDLLARIFKHPGIVHIRKAQGILRLGDKYGNQRLEASCKRALFFDNDSYKSIKTILTQGLETNDPMQEQQKSSGKVALPREASYLRSCADIEPNNITREASI